jgi:hypothetical protein
MTLIRIGLLYPSIHNSLIANKWIEVKFAQHMMCAMYMHYAFLNAYLFWGSKGVIRVSYIESRISNLESRMILLGFRTK